MGKYDFRDKFIRNFVDFYEKGYCWPLTKREIEQIISQSSGSRASIPAEMFMNVNCPFALTEAGVIALSKTMDSEIASDIGFNIAKAIVEVRLKNRKNRHKNVDQPYLNNHHDENLIELLDILIEQNKTIVEYTTKIGHLFTVLIEPENSEILLD